MSQLSTFTLKSSNADFSQRQKNIFDHLNVLENSRKHNDASENVMEVDEKSNEDKHQMRFTKQYRGKESIFKKPQKPALKNFMQSIPDFKKNPHKWTKYSLDDVKDDDISDKTNTQAALSFLKDLRNRRTVEVEDDVSAEENSPKIVFQRHTRKEKEISESDSEDSKSSFRNSKVVMPEYIVGQKIKKEKMRTKIGKSCRGEELKLCHLYEEEEDD